MPTNIYTFFLSIELNVWFQSIWFLDASGERDLLSPIGASTTLLLLFEIQVFVYNHIIIGILFNIFEEIDHEYLVM